MRTYKVVQRYGEITKEKNVFMEKRQKKRVFMDKRGKELIDSQRMFCDEAVKEAQLALHPHGDRVFIPAERKSDEPSGD